MQTWTRWFLGTCPVADVYSKCSPTLVQSPSADQCVQETPASCCCQRRLQSTTLIGCLKTSVAPIDVLLEMRHHHHHCTATVAQLDGEWVHRLSTVIGLLAFEGSEVFVVTAAVRNHQRRRPIVGHSAVLDLATWSSSSPTLSQGPEVPRPG